MCYAVLHQMLFWVSECVLYTHYICAARKASLALLRKMIHYITPLLLDEICSQEGTGVNFGSQLVEVLSVVLDNEVCVTEQITLECCYVLSH